MTDQLAVDYEGSEPFPDGGTPPRTFEGAIRVAVTAAIVVVPFAGLGVAVWFAWGHGLHLTDILLATAFYLVTGLGVTIGFHRLLTHRSFTAAPALRVVLAIAGSMSFEGDVIGWVAIHRRHHAFTDRPGDPHSPYRYGTHLAGQLRGLAHAHMGWLLRDDPTPADTLRPGHGRRPGHAEDLDERSPPCASSRSGCRSPWAGRSAAAGAPRWPPCCGPGWSASPCSSTSPGASTRCAM